MRWERIEYSVRVSHRAKRVILKVGVNGLEVVVPRWFGKRRLPEILEAHRDWIEKEIQRVKEFPAPAAPECVNLNAIDENWQVTYQPPPGPASKGRFLVEESASKQLLIQGDAGDVRGVSSALTRWLHQKAHAHLVPWLDEISREVDIPFEKATVRGQSTRWASCSRLGNISINRSLLFLPRQLVRHVFLHELCHIRALNHSPEFWNLFHRLEPDCRELEVAVRKANGYVPRWVSLR